MTVDDEIELDNQRIRAEYLSEYECYSYDELYSETNSADLIHTWKEENYIFSITQNGLELFPRFQFLKGKPIEVISVLLARMPSDMSRWQIALWFSSPNGFLGGQSPQECLTMNQKLIYALDQESHAIYG